MLRLRQGLRVVPWSELPADGQAAVRKMTGQESVPALLVPQTGRGTVKAIDSNTVDLLAGICSAETRGRDLPAALKALILDEVLEIQSSQGYVSGPEAASMMAANPQTGETQGQIARLSKEALRYAAALPITDPRSLSARIYRYNTAPFTPGIQSSFGNAVRTAAILGLAGAAPLISRLIREGYERVDHEQWLAWTRRRFVDPEAASTLRHKLYVSPILSALPEVVDRALKVAIDLHVPSFKIGKSAGNLLRPDKFVLYLDSAETLEAVSAQLQRELAEFPAQGVPFTRMLDQTGMLSAGADPPRSLCISGWAQAESWRGWVADRLALALLQARSFSNAETRCEFALTKLSIEGIDTRDWVPTDQLWKGELR